MASQELSTDYLVGLDIGTTKICVIIGFKNKEGKLQIKGFGQTVSRGVKEGGVRNMNQVINCIKEALEKAAASAGFNPTRVNVGVAGKHIDSKCYQESRTRTSVEEISRAEVAELTSNVRHIASGDFDSRNKIIDIFPLYYTIDNETDIKEPVGMAGTKLEGVFNVITGQTGSVRNIRKCVEQSNLQINNLILEPLASSLSVLSKEEKEEGVALIDIGGGTTDIAIFHEGILKYTCVLPFGGNIITSDIKQGLNLPQGKAEGLKIDYGDCISQKVKPNSSITITPLRGRSSKLISLNFLAQIIQARVEEIIQMVMIKIKESKYKDQLIAGIIITGGGSQLKNIKQLFHQKTQLDVQIGYPKEHLDIENTNTNNLNHPRYATCIGLVLAQFGESNPSEVQNEEVQDTKEPNDTAEPFKPDNFFQRLVRGVGRVFLEDYDQQEVD